jgi:hypothetical protein
VVILISWILNVFPTKPSQNAISPLLFITSVADPLCHFDAAPDPDPAYPYHFDADPDHSFHFDADVDPDADPSFQIKAQNLEKALKWANIPYILACHLQIDADPDPAYHFDADPDTYPTFQFDADPDPQHFL